MKEYTIIRRPEDFHWSLIPSLQMDFEPFPGDHGIRAQAQICYDDEALYVRLSAVEKNIRAELHGPLGEICEDSCLEFFFCPMEDDLRYFNLEFNSNGAAYLGFGSGLANLQRLLPDSPVFFPEITFADDGWTLEYAVPYRFIQLFFPDFAPTPGKKIRANCYKCGELTVKPHWLCWNPVPPEPFTFHCPTHFGVMYFA